MKSLKNIANSLLYSLLFFLFSSFIITIFNYFNIINYKISNILKLIITPLSILFGGFKIGKISSKKGWLEGLKLGSIVTIFLLIITIILNSFKTSYFIYMIILIISGSLGGMIGISKK